MRAWRGLGLAMLIATLVAGAPVAVAQADDAAPANGAPLDRSLVPGLRAELAASRAEAQAQMGKIRAADREMNQRGAERDRWQAQVAEVDKDKALYEKNLEDWFEETQRYGAAVDAHNARCGAIDPNNTALAAQCATEKQQGDAWQANLKGASARLDQAKADYLQRYDTIGKEIDQLSARIDELFSTSMAARSAAARAKANAQAIEQRLIAAGYSPEGP